MPTINEAQISRGESAIPDREHGMKAFRVFLPTTRGRAFHGDQVATFCLGGERHERLAGMGIKLHRRVIGPYLLQVNYQTCAGQGGPGDPARRQTGRLMLARFVTISLQRAAAGKRSIIRPKLCSEEWQSIPRALQQDLQTARPILLIASSSRDFSSPSSRRLKRRTPSGARA